jgi:hypothetical protein
MYGEVKSIYHFDTGLVKTMLYCNIKKKDGNDSYHRPNGFRIAKYRGDYVIVCNRDDLGCNKVGLLVYEKYNGVSTHIPWLDIYKCDIMEIKYDERQRVEVGEVKEALEALENLSKIIELEKCGVENDDLEDEKKIALGTFENLNKVYFDKDEKFDTLQRLTRLEVEIGKLKRHTKYSSRFNI